ncbi:MAG TPA: SMP-30/gluconolactonase/LRE family protein [Rhizomicrobium sp.]|nr:SMP-30/gluconolactonase/LRE family protein [Rhizomicrobium sp.]
MSPKPECVWAVEAELGEGPLWWPRDQGLWFVDIKQKRIHRFDPNTARGRSWTAPAPPGFLAPLPNGQFIAGLMTGLHTFDPAAGTFTLRHTVERHKPGNRLNDGAVDGQGYLWFGSMDDGEKHPSGCLHRLEDSGPREIDPGYVITNGPAFSPDGRTLYHTDTLERVIHAFDLGPRGQLANKRVFVTIEDGAGYPDGPTVDSEGCLWTGLFAGWAARRYSPQGELLMEVRFPCANVTKIAFAGADLRTVYATTARKGLDAAARAAQPLAGALFRFEVDVPGQPQREVLHG